MFGVRWSVVDNDIHLSLCVHLYPQLRVPGKEHVTVGDARDYRCTWHHGGTLRSRDSSDKHTGPVKISDNGSVQLYLQLYIYSSDPLTPVGGLVMVVGMPREIITSA